MMIRMKTKNWLWPVWMFLPWMVYAQENTSSRESYLRAEDCYHIGLFEQTIGHLDENLKGYDSKMKVNAYRLMALCYLATDRKEEAVKYIHLLLKLAPYYTTTVQDPERFTDLINSLRNGGVRLVTASQQPETLEEAPVPVTLITEEMIKGSGARNLKELLLSYVPGMTAVENVNEMNIAMHGIYSSGQQKILIMQDGHRLNSRSTNAAAPDYSISLNKIKQVEVLRAPASSLYGNVALTAVINLITKEGTDINGGSLTAGWGSYRSLKANFVFGKQLLDGDFMVWGSYYSSRGQTFIYPKGENKNQIPADGSAIIGGFNSKPSYDAGFRFKWNGLYLSASLQHSKMVQPFSPLLGNTFSYNQYASYNGEKPGNSRNTTRTEAGYAWSKENISADVAFYADFEQVSNYDVAGDTIPPSVAIVPTGTNDTIFSQRGVFQQLNWNDYTYGISTKTRYDYRISGLDGNIMGGIQYEQYRLSNTSFRLGDQYDRIVWTAPPTAERLLTGTDRNFSFFLQGKQYINKHMLINAGIRYDYKLRSNRKSIHAFSPRLSFVYLINRTCNLKAGYSHAFVDAPYFYRNNTTKSYRGGSELKPEYLDALYIDFSWNSREPGLSYECNLYYNYVSNMICKSTAGGTPYQNAGKVTIAGIENSLHYHSKGLDVYLTLSYMRLLSAQNYNYAGNLIKGIPEFSSRLIIGHSILPEKYRFHRLKVQGNITAFSRQYGLPGRILADAGIIYKFKQNIEFSGWVYNIFNTSYKIDGDAGNPIQQSGRYILGKITIKL